MPAVCLVFAMHLPARLRRYSIFDASPLYIDAAGTAQAVAHAAKTCYLPLLKILLSAARKAEGAGPAGFRVGLSLTGVALELLERHAPEVTQHLHALHATKCCEFLGETYDGSLAALYSRTEFADQVRLQSQMIKRLFGAPPTVFRNTELLYSSEIARMLPELGFTGVLAEGVETVLASRSPSFVYTAAGTDNLRLLLRHRALCDAIGRQFAPVGDFTAGKVADQKLTAALHDIGGQVCNLFFDAESFGLWQPASTGALDFIASLPARLAVLNCQLVTPSDAIEKFPSAGQFDVPHITSGSGTNRDAAPWLGNAMQKNALQDLYKLESAVKTSHDRTLLADFRALTAADHVWYMATRLPEDEKTRRPSPYESPYDAYINFMNIVENLKSRAAASAEA